MFAFKNGTKRNVVQKKKSKKRSNKKSKIEIDTNEEDHVIFGNNANGQFRKNLYEKTWTRINEVKLAINIDCLQNGR